MFLYWHRRYINHLSSATQSLNQQLCQSAPPWLHRSNKHVRMLDRRIKEANPACTSCSAKIRSARFVWARFNNTFQRLTFLLFHVLAQPWVPPESNQGTTQQETSTMLRKFITPPESVSYVTDRFMYLGFIEETYGERHLMQEYVSIYRKDIGSTTCAS